MVAGSKQTRAGVLFVGSDPAAGQDREAEMDSRPRSADSVQRTLTCDLQQKTPRGLPLETS